MMRWTNNNLSLAPVKGFIKCDWLQCGSGKELSWLKWHVLPRKVFIIVRFDDASSHTRTHLLKSWLWNFLTASITHSSTSLALKVPHSRVQQHYSLKLNHTINVALCSLCTGSWYICHVFHKGHRVLTFLQLLYCDPQRHHCGSSNVVWQLPWLHQTSNTFRKWRIEFFEVLCKAIRASYFFCSAANCTSDSSARSKFPWLYIFNVLAHVNPKRWKLDNA